MRKRTGLTLLEVILSIAILAIVVVIFLGIQTFSLSTTRSAADSQELVRSAEAAIEQITGEYISGISNPESTVTGVTYLIERCEFTDGDIQCSDQPIDDEVGIFITATAKKNDQEESLYRFVRLP